MMASADHAFSYSEEVTYPSSDGKPMADNTWQARWIVRLYGNLRALLDLKQVFVAADIFWYPVQGDREQVVAPDVLVAFGRPDGDRADRANRLH